MTRGACLATLFALAGIAHATERRPERRFVVIVANNLSVTPGVSPLSYADDDGARWYDLLAPTAAEISLFTVLDSESQRVFRDEARVAESPTRAALFARLAEYNHKMSEARKEGVDPVLFFVFVGHGELAADGEGFVSLLDGKLRRSELFRNLIAPSTAAFNHVVIDACNSYLLVARRGAGARGPDLSAALRQYVSEENLGRYPNTGVLLSTSRAQASHEWSEYGGGVFSQEVRSALAGAADVNGDGRVEYSELTAFLAAANLHVDDPRAHIDVFAQAPAIDRARPMMDLAASRLKSFLVLPPQVEGRFFLEDARGARYADFHKAAEQQLIIGLVPSSYYYLRTEDEEAQLALDRPGAIRLSPSSWHRRALAARGPLAESLRRHLFEAPFGPSFYRGYVASRGELPVEEHPAPFAPAEPDRVDSLAARLDALARPTDSFHRNLMEWARHRLAASDLEEAERTLRALEEHAR